MLTPVSKSNSNPIYPMPIVENKSSTVNLDSEQPVLAKEEMQVPKNLLENVIRSQLVTIERLTKENEKALEEIAKKRASIAKTEAQNLELEAYAATLEQQLQQLKENPYLEVDPVENQEPVSFWGRLWEGTKSAVSSVGRFCYENRQLFRAGIGTTGLILCCIFPPATLPIFLGVGGSIALFEWFSSWFK